MVSSIVYRHNIMNINSIETFLSIKGGFNGQIRDVYFVRSLGGYPGIENKIIDIDQKMCLEEEQNRLSYFRVKALPKLQDMADMQYYTSQYENWKGKKSISLKSITSPVLATSLGNALENVLQEYRKHKQGVTESIEKNYAVKLLFWVDSIVGKVLKEWNERKCIKVIAEDVIKEQEYLFYYLLTLIGCDVLLLQFGADVDTSEDLKKKSLRIDMGAFLKVNVPEFVKKVREQPKVREQVSNSTASNSTRTSTATAKATPSSAVAPKSNPVSIKMPERTRTGRTVSDSPKSEGAEKSFEELARLASSVVMITVFDRHGEPEATGSGIMIGKDGYILTNNHVIEGGYVFAVQIEEDDNIYPADAVIKTNKVLDLAIIRIDKKLNPIPIYDGKKKLVRGQKVVAIGSPLGLFNSVSDGIISGFRSIRDVEMIQFTAPISHGSSGGAVLNMAGQIIGISTAGIDAGQNINLAVDYENIRAFSRGFY